VQLVIHLFRKNSNGLHKSEGAGERNERMKKYTEDGNDDQEPIVLIN